jgi:hypothetical protein
VEHRKGPAVSGSSADVMKKRTTFAVALMGALGGVAVGREIANRQSSARVRTVAMSVEEDLTHLRENVRQAGLSKSSSTNCRLFLTRAAHDEFANLGGRVRSLEFLDPVAGEASRLTALLNRIEVEADSVFEPFTGAEGDWNPWNCQGWDTYRAKGDD